MTRMWWVWPSAMESACRFAMALQCFPTVVTAKQEFGGWPLALAQLVFFTGGAWLGAVIIVQGLRALGVA